MNLYLVCTSVFYGGLVTVVTPFEPVSLGYTNKIEFLDGKVKDQTANPTDHTKIIISCLSVIMYLSYLSVSTVTSKDLSTPRNPSTASRERQNNKNKNLGCDLF